MYGYVIFQEFEKTLSVNIIWDSVELSVLTFTSGAEFTGGLTFRSHLQEVILSMKYSMLCQTCMQFVSSSGVRAVQIVGVWYRDIQVEDTFALPFCFWMP